MPVWLEEDVSTADEMRVLFCRKLANAIFGEACPDTMPNLWTKMIRSGARHGAYHLKQRVIMAACFPHVKEYPRVQAVCVQLGPDDIEQTSTPDASRIGWYNCELSFHLDSSAWRLDEELSELKDPPAVCRVTVCVSNLEFRKFASEENIIRLTTQPISLTLFTRKIETPDDMLQFVCKFEDMEGVYHCNITRQTTARIWFDLINSRSGKNVFVMRTPFLIRIASEAYKLPLSLKTRVMRCKTECIATYGVPPELDPDSFIGLYSANYYLAFSVAGNGVSSTKHELWPGIPLDFAHLEQQLPGCKVDFRITRIQFVCAISEREVVSMCPILPWICTQLARSRWVGGFVDFFNRL